MRAFGALPWSLVLSLVSNSGFASAHTVSCTREHLILPPFLVGTYNAVVSVMIIHLMKRQVRRLINDYTRILSLLFRCNKKVFLSLSSLSSAANRHFGTENYFIMRALKSRLLKGWRFLSI